MGKARKGHYVVVRLVGRNEANLTYDMIETYTVRRVVKATREGEVTHVCTEREWQWGAGRGPGKERANAGNNLRYQSVVLVYTLGQHARDPGLASLADGDLYGGGHKDLDAIRAAVRKAVGKEQYNVVQDEATEP